jgi:hypothetical protein
VVDAAGPENMHVKAVGDINGDGFVDLIVAGTGGELLWYEYPNWTRHSVSAGDDGWSTDAEVGDMDRDGDMDIVISDWYKHKRLVWFENFHVRGIHWRMHVIGDVRAHDIELADLDGDKDLDVVTRQQGKDGNVLEMARGWMWPIWTTIAIRTSLQAAAGTRHHLMLPTVTGSNMYSRQPGPIAIAQHV